MLAVAGSDSQPSFYESCAVPLDHTCPLWLSLPPMFVTHPCPLSAPLNKSHWRRVGHLFSMPDLTKPVYWHPDPRPPWQIFIFSLDCKISWWNFPHLEASIWSPNISNTDQTRLVSEPFYVRICCWFVIISFIRWCILLYIISLLLKLNPGLSKKKKKTELRENYPALDSTCFLDLDRKVPLN